MILQAAKLVGAGLSTIALAGVGAGIGTVFAAKPCRSTFRCACDVFVAQTVNKQ